MAFSPDELRWLMQSPDSSRAIEQAERMELSKKTAVSDLSALRAAWGEHARAIAELVEARRIAARKSPDARGWWTDKDAAQQATPHAVAEFRAKYLRSLGAVAAMDVTCSVGTEVRALHAEGFSALGGDISRERVTMAAQNVPGCSFIVSDATAPALSPSERQRVIIADPARRNSSGRIHNIRDVQPSLPDLVTSYPGHELAVKCAPGIDFADVADWAGQVDVISVKGEVKEACVYTRGLVTEDGGQAMASGIVRRAVLLDETGVTTLTSADPHIDEEERGIAGHGDYLIDPDGAIVRAGLVRHYAARHGLWQLDPRIAYLTGDSVPAGVRGFRVVERVPLKKLKAALVAHEAKSVEILVRGVNIDPDQLRKKMKLTGSRAWSVVITRVGKQGVAFICEPCMGE